MHDRLLLFICLCLTTTAVAEEHIIDHENEAFSKQQLTIKRGDTVKFANNDPYFHNVYSVSSTKFFDLGSVPQGEYKNVTFKNSGIVDVQCALHPDAKLTITVE